MTLVEGSSEIAVCTIDITPHMPRALVGYIARKGLGKLNRESTLEVNITALRKGGEAQPQVLLIAIDSLFIDEAFVRDFAIRARIPELENRILAIASHTHGAPNLQDRDFMQCPRDIEYRNFVLDDAARAARALLKDSSAWTRVKAIRYKTVPLNRLVCRRKNGLYLDLRAKRLRWGCHFGQNLKGITDPFVRSIEILDTNGVRAVWWSYPAHPAFLPDQNAISADFPGYVRKHLQSQYSDASIAFLPGLCGSVIPSVNSSPRTGNWWRDLIFRLPFIPGLGHFTEQGFKNWANQIIAAFDIADVTVFTSEASLEFSKNRISTVFNKNNPEFPVTLAMLNVGPLRLLCLSGEPVAHWRPLLAPFANASTIMTGYMAGAAGYIATSELLPEGGYEVHGFKTPFDVSGTIVPDINDKITEAFRDITVNGKL